MCFRERQRTSTWKYIYRGYFFLAVYLHITRARMILMKTIFVAFYSTVYDLPKLQSDLSKFEIDQMSRPLSVY